MFGIGGRLMLLEIRLVNIKSHVDTKIRFTEGVNAILGENGAGKTTIIEAIGFALFNVKPYKRIGEFLRRGEKKGEIRITLKGKDDRVYRVVRKIEENRTAEYYVEDVELGRVAEGENEVLSWIKENFEFESDPKTMFDNVIGVKQGMMTSQFLNPPNVREATFSPVIGVESYRKAYEKSKDYENWIKEEIDRTAIEEVELRNKVENLRNKKIELERLRKLQEEIEEEMNKISNQIKMYEVKYKKLEEFKEKISNYKLNFELTKDKIESIESKLKELKERFERAKEAEKKLNELKPIAIEGEKIEERLDKLIKLKDTLISELHNLNIKKEKLEEYKKRLSDLEEKVSDINEIKAEVEKLRELAKIERELDEQLKKLRVAEERIKGLLNQKSILKKEIDRKIEKIKNKDIIKNEIKNLEEKLDKLKDLEDKKEKTVKAYYALETKLKLDKEQLKEMLKGICPILGEECKRIAEAGRKKKKELEKEVEKIKVLKANIAKLEKVLSAKKALENKLSNLKLELSYIEEFEKDVEEKKEKLKEITKELEILERKVSKINKVKEEFDKVRGSSNRFAELSERLKQKEEMLEEVGNLKSKIVSLREEIKKLPEVNEKLKAIEQNIVENKEKLKELKPILNEYVSLKTIANERDEIESKLKEKIEEKKALEEKYIKIKKEIDDINKKFSDEKYERIKKKLEDLRRSYFQLKGRLDEIKNRIESLTKDVLELEKEEKRLEEVLNKKRLAEKKYLFIKDLREIFKKAIPEITRAYTDAVSIEANRIFCELMNDYSWEIRWTNDYSIKAIYRGREIDFSQMSGGEQMCAAIAVRLALLKVLSSTNIAFFDEPTQNMDEVRRRNLANQISRVEGFNQIFVISHDDSFEDVVENAIKLKKEDGITIVE